MVLNTAYLVDNAAADVFVDTVAELHRSHPSPSASTSMGRGHRAPFATLDEQ